MPFEMTQVEAHLKRYMEEIEDVLTKQEDVQHYARLISCLKALRNNTNIYYKVNYPMGIEVLDGLRGMYKSALRAVDDLMAEEGIGPAGLQLRAIARELRPLLAADQNALNLARRESDFSNLTLPELISRVRMQAADLGDVTLPEGDDPIPVRIQGTDSMQAGIFTPSKQGENGNQEAAYSRIAGILARPETVTKAVPTLLIHKGGTKTGTFISRANGLDPTKVGPADPFLSFTEANLDTGAAVAGLSSMQLLDFLSGSEPRGPEHCRLRFNPPYQQGDQIPRLVGLTAQAEGIRFSGGEPDRQRMNSLGIIPMSMYAALEAEDFEVRLDLAVKDLGLSEETFQSIVERRNALVKKVRDDREYFADKPDGFVESGRIRVVPDDRMSEYSIRNLRAIQPGGIFDAFLKLPETAATRAKQEQNAANAGGLPVIPTATVIGNGLQQEPDPLNAARPETICLRINSLVAKQDAKGGQNQRYPVKWTENGVTRKGFFTLPEYNSNGRIIRDTINAHLEDPDNQKYRDVLLAIRDYYSVPENADRYENIPGSLERLPWGELGISDERVLELQDAGRLDHELDMISTEIAKKNLRIKRNNDRGAAVGQRIELRNVAMSDIADVLGVPSLLARSTTAKVEINGKIIDGIFMETADGVDIHRANPGTAMAAITADQAGEVYNPQGL